MNHGGMGFLLLLTAFYGFAFGATRLLLRRSAWEQYSLEAPWLTGPALLVLLVSVLGARDPYELPAWQAWSLLAAGWTLSAVVAMWDRVELAALVRQCGQRALLVALPACLAAGVMLWFFQGKPWDNIAVPWIIEYINYGELAAVMTGHHHGVPGTAVCLFCEMHHTVRFGQDIVVASVAQVAAVHPMQAVLPLAVLFRFQNAIALGLLVFAMNPSGKRKQWVVLVLVLDAVLLFETLLFGSSFFSSNCTTPLYMLYLVWLACQQEFRVRECMILVLMNLFFLVTYPEFLVIAKCFEGLAVLVALWRRNRLTWLPLVVCNVVCFAMHPLAIVEKIGVLSRHMGGTDGWNVVGNPVLDPMHFINDLLGLRYGQMGYNPLRGFSALAYIIVPLVICQIVIGLFLLARRYRAGVLLLGWLGLVVAVHARSVINETNFYAAFKVVSHTYFVLILAAAAPLFGASMIRRRAAVGIMVLWLAVAGVACHRLVLCIHQEGYNVRYSRLQASLEPCASGQTVAVLCAAREPLYLVNLIGGDSNLCVATLTAEQQDKMKTRGLARWTDCTKCQPDGTYYDGIIVTESEVVKTGQCVVGNQLLRLDLRRVLSRPGGLVVCEGSIHRTNAVTLAPFYWIFQERSRGPEMFATSTRLRLTGEVTAQHTVPYRITCQLEALQWSQEVVIDKVGDFEVMLNLPQTAVGKTIAVEFRDYGTFRPVERMRRSADDRYLGFMLKSMAFEKE